MQIVRLKRYRVFLVSMLLGVSLALTSVLAQGEDSKSFANVADETEFPTKSLATNHPLYFRNKAHVGYRAYAFSYDEPGLMKDSGVLHGVGGAVSGPTFNDQATLRGEADFVGGSADYDGHLINLDTGQRTPHQSSSKYYIYNLRSLLGLNIPVGYQSLAMPYIGLGFRHVDNISSDQYGYDRHITYYYIPIGTEVSSALTPAWTVGANAEYDLLLRGRVTSDLYVGQSSGSLHFDQKKGYGLNFSLFSTWVISPTVSLRVQPYYQYWKVADSTRVAVGTRVFWEPANRTSSGGLNLSISL